MLLPREHLHLSFLDLHSPYGSFESSRYFESKIKILDLEGRVAARPVVLIARLESDKTAYALERQQNGLYSLCQLGSWVDLATLSELATVSCSYLLRKRAPQTADSATSKPLITPQLHKENKKRRLAIEAIQSLVKKPARSRSVSGSTQPTELTTQQSISLTAEDDVASLRVSNVEASQDGALPPSTPETRTKDQPIPEPREPRADESPTQPSADEIFDNIRNQYLDALYHSMVCSERPLLANPC